MKIKKYEYRIRKYDGKGAFGGKLELPPIEKEFNELGSDGWELISMIDTTEGVGSTKWVMATFRRTTES